MENTIENKAKFFALYWGQELIIQYGYESPFIINSRFKGRLEKGYLQLTPLSQITDEDAYNAGITKARLKNHINHPHIMTPLMCDYLRSKGYALPWMGLSVEQLVSFGWVKLKEPC